MKVFTKTFNILNKEYILSFYSLTLGDVTLMLGGQYTGVLLRGGTSLEMTRVKVSKLLKSSAARGRRLILIIHFYVESGKKMIQFNIQFKIESRIFIQ